jgi:hypothetical protein
VCSHAVELSCRGGRGDGGRAAASAATSSPGSAKDSIQIQVCEFIDLDRSKLQYRCEGKRVRSLPVPATPSMGDSLRDVSTSPASLFHGHGIFGLRSCLPWAQISAGLCHGF